ncbi:MAG: transporter substrate-binding domain-containing protein [Arenicellales bacterium]
MNQFKKLIARSIFVLAAPLLATSAQAADSVLHTILKEGVLKVGTTGDWNPMTMRDAATNKYTGFDIDVSTKLAEDLGVEIEYVPTDWKTLVAGVTADKYHMTGSASVNPKRAKVAGYSISYVEVGQLPMIHKKNADRFKSWDDINQAGVKVAANLGTTQEQYIKTFFPNATHVVVESPARDWQDVLAGRSDASITSNIEAHKLVEKYPDQMMIVPVDQAKARTPLAVLLPQGDQVWINYVNHWISLQQARGFFDGLKKKWGL